jgi:hypothetical protein
MKMEMGMSSRRLISWFGLMILLLVSACAPAASGPVVKVQPPEAAPRVGETLRVQVRAENIAALTAFEAHLSFDASRLEVVQVDEGGFVQADYNVQNSFDNAAGTLDYAVAQIDRPAASGSGVLFEIVFRAKAAGGAWVRFRETPAAPAGAILSDPQGLAIKLSLADGSLQIEP